MMKLKADNRIFQTIQKSCNLMNLIKKYNEFESIYNFKNLLFAQNEYINVKYLIIVLITCHDSINARLKLQYAVIPILLFVGGIRNTMLSYNFKLIYHYHDH